MDHLKTTCGACGKKLRMPYPAVSPHGKCVCGVTLVIPTREEVEAALPERFRCDVIGVPSPDAAHPADPTAPFGNSHDDSLIIRSLDNLE